MIARLSVLLGMSPKPRRWERPLLFFGALCAADFVWLILAPSLSGNPTAADTTLTLFNIRPPSFWLELLVGNLLMTVIATLAFGLLRNVFAIPITAIAYSLLWTGISYLSFIARLPEGLSEDVPFWDAYQVLNSISNFLFAVLFFTLLEMAMRAVKDIALALFLGAVATSLMMFPIHILLPRLFLETSTPVRLRVMFLPFNILSQIFFMLALWGGLRVTSGPRPLEQAPAEPRISKGFYVGTLAVTNGVTLVVFLAIISILSFTKAWEFRRPQDVTPLWLLLGFVLLLATYGAVVFCHLIYKMWQTIQDGYVRTSPAFAVGGLFIPFYNLYWAFKALPGFVPEYYAFAWRHGLYIPRLSQDVFTAYVIICIIGLIPFLNLLLLPAGYVLLLVMASEICKAVNAVPVVPPAPLPRPPWEMAHR